MLRTASPASSNIPSRQPRHLPRTRPRPETSAKHPAAARDGPMVEPLRRAKGLKQFIFSLNRSLDACLLHRFTFLKLFSARIARHADNGLCILHSIFIAQVEETYTKWTIETCLESQPRFEPEVRQEWICYCLTLRSESTLIFGYVGRVGAVRSMARATNGRRW